MKATLEFVSQRFAEFNKLCFDSSLPDIPLRISNARTYLGVCRYHKRRKLLGGYEMYGFNICISARFDMPQQEIEDTIIHEMIHYCIWLNGIRDTSAHGREFRRMMENINSTYGRHITISHRGDKQIREQAVDPRPRPHVIALITFTNDRTGVKVLPAIRRNVIRYKRGVILSGRIRSIEFYATTEPWFNRFPCSSALNVIYKDHQEILPHLEGATHLDI